MIRTKIMIRGHRVGKTKQNNKINKNRNRDRVDIGYIKNEECSHKECSPLQYLISKFSAKETFVNLFYNRFFVKFRKKNKKNPLKKSFKNPNASYLLRKKN